VNYICYIDEVNSKREREREKLHYGALQIHAPKTAHWERKLSRKQFFASFVQFFVFTTTKNIVKDTLADNAWRNNPFFQLSLSHSHTSADSD
jgi:hypothetical protein